MPRGARSRRAQPHHPEHRGEEDPHERAVHARRGLDLDVEARHVVVLAATAVRARAGHDGAGEQHERRQADEHPAEHHRAPGHDQVCGTVGLTGAPHEDQRVGEEQDRQQEVRHHERRLEVEGDRQLPEHRLREHAGDESPRQPDEVAPSRRAHQAPEHGHDHRHRHQPGEQPVHVLDGRVLARRAVGLQLALRTADADRAPESRARQSHRRAGDDDDRQQHRGHDRDPAVRERAQVRHSHERPMVPTGPPPVRCGRADAGLT